MKSKFFYLSSLATVLLLAACKKPNTIVSPPPGGGGPAGAPESGFTYEILAADPDLLTVKFTDISKNAKKWKWEFGDDSTSTIQNPIHTYSYIPGTVHTDTVKLTVLNGDGVISPVATHIITVGKHIIPAITSVKFVESPLYHIVRDNDFHDIGTDIHVGYEAVHDDFIEWDFNDGSPHVYNLRTPIHTYKKSGTYNITLKITSISGDVATQTMPIDVNVWDGIDIQAVTLTGTSPKAGEKYFLWIKDPKYGPTYDRQFAQSNSLPMPSDGNLIFDATDPMLASSFPFTLHFTPGVIPIPDTVSIQIWKAANSRAIPAEKEVIKVTYIADMNTLWNYALTVTTADNLMLHPETVITHPNPVAGMPTDNYIKLDFKLHKMPHS